MNLTSSSRPKSREGGLLLPATRLTLWGELGQVLQRESVLGYLFVLPAVLLLVGLVAYPFIIALWLSLTDAYVGPETSVNESGLPSGSVAFSV